MPLRDPRDIFEEIPLQDFPEPEQTHTELEHYTFFNCFWEDDSQSLFEDRPNSIVNRNTNLN